MKLRNKKTGEIVKVNNLNAFVHLDEETKIYNSLADLNEEWEDYEEPEVIYYLSWDGVVLHSADKTGWQDTKQIGNYFETKEEAEKAVEKLKALKELKDKGFKFDGWIIDDGLRVSICTNFDGGNIYSESEKEIRTILDLLFGDEE